MRIAPFFVVVAAALCLSACFPPTTTHPVGTSVGIANDPALVGLWRGKMQNDQDRSVYFHFLPESDGHITVVMVQGGAEPDGDWTIASITTATLGANHLMNAQITFSDGHADADEDQPHGTVPVLYRIEGGRMTLYLLDEDATKAAIRSHAIAGTIEDGQFGDATITASPKDLDAFLSSRKGAALFGERFATLTRME